jgi:hypothetical protein
MLSKRSDLLEDVHFAKECHFANEHENPEFIKAVESPAYFCSDFSKLAAIHRILISSAFKWDANRAVTSTPRLK